MKPLPTTLNEDMMSNPTPGARPEPLPASPKLLPARQPWRWISAIALALALLGFIASLAVNPNLQWNVVGSYLLSINIIEGVLSTIELTVLCMAIAIVLGILIATAAMSHNIVFQSAAALYVWFFRGVPLLVQLIFWFNLALLWPVIGAGQFAISTNTLISGFTASVLGLALHEAAYMAEIVRGGILTVDKGQTEAARSIGMPERMLFRRIILPQAMRAIVPPTGNQLISLLKATSLVAFIAGGDLMTVVQNIYSQNFLIIPLLLVATIWYLFITSVATIGQRYLERHFGQGFDEVKNTKQSRRAQRRLTTSEVVE